MQRALHKPKPVDEVVFDKIRFDKLHQTIAELPESQQRRLLLHYELGLTYEQIGEMEGCLKVAVKYIVDKAIAAIKKKIKYY